jgi:hypothetical protein
MKIYTGIGSREVPENVQNAMSQEAYFLASQGYTLRSGGAKGSDAMFQWGHESYYRDEDLHITKEEIYIPWVNFKMDRFLDTHNNVIPKHLLGKCMEIASEVHPHWERCSFGAKKLHARNVCQVLGNNLDTPSDFVLFYAKEVNGVVQGGTATAVHLARLHGIPTINMFFDDWEDKLEFEVRRK